MKPGFGSNTDLFVCGWVYEVDGGCMKEMKFTLFTFEGVIRAVSCIAEDSVSDGGELTPNLMRDTGVNCDFENRIPIVVFDRSIKGLSEQGAFASG